MIYFAQPKNGGPIRIGTSNNVRRRAIVLGTAVPGGVDIITTIPGGVFREAILLELFKPLRVDRDWVQSCVITWRFLIEEAMGGDVKWLPPEDDLPMRDCGERIISLFGSYENAAKPLSYSNAAGIVQAVNHNYSSASYQLRAKVKLQEMLRSGVVPDYIAQLGEFHGERRAAQ